MLTAKLFFSVLLFVISAGGVVLPSMQQHQNSENNGVQHPVVIASIAIVALLGFIYLVKDIIDDLRTEPVDTEVEITFWTSAERSNQAQDYCLYLQKYPQGQFEKLARERVNDDCEIEKQPTLEELTAQIEAQTQEKMQQQLAQLTLEARQQAKREAEEKLQQALDERTSKIEREEKQQRINLSYQEKSKSDKKNENRQTAERYLVKGSLVKDTVTGLMWMRCSLGQNLDSPSCKGKVVKYNWQQALNIAADFSYAGYSDWHLPTIKELNTLVYCSNGKKIHYKEDGYDDIKSEGDWGCDSENSGAYQKPTIKQTIFPNTPSSWFWSSSPNANYNRSSRAWFVSFTYGCDDCGYNSYNYAVRLVRAGQ